LRVTPTCLQELPMPWTYHQLSGALEHNNEAVGTGYSGAGTTMTAANGRNNPALEAVHNVGPIPVGRYQIGKSFEHPHKGPVVMPLTPVGHNALGRSGFLIHGDNAQNNASEGCIILRRNFRDAIAADVDKDLFVVR
jgi:hypothetical protein